jgi:hypothetical protein
MFSIALKMIHSLVFSMIESRSYLILVGQQSLASPLRGRAVPATLSTGHGNPCFPQSDYTVVKSGIEYL